MFGILDQKIVPTASKGNAHNMVCKLREIYSIQKSPFVAQMFVCAKTISSDFTSGVWKTYVSTPKRRKNKHIKIFTQLLTESLFDNRNEREQILLSIFRGSRGVS